MFFALFFMAGLGLGVALLALYQRRQVRKLRRIPRDWPLRARFGQQPREAGVGVAL